MIFWERESVGVRRHMMPSCVLCPRVGCVYCVVAGVSQPSVMNKKSKHKNVSGRLPTCQKRPSSAAMRYEVTVWSPATPCFSCAPIRMSALCVPEVASPQADHVAGTPAYILHGRARSGAFFFLPWGLFFVWTKSPRGKNQELTLSTAEKWRGGVANTKKGGGTEQTTARSLPNNHSPLVTLADYGRCPSQAKWTCCCRRTRPYGTRWQNSWYKTTSKTPCYCSCALGGRPTTRGKTIHTGIDLG